MYLFVTFNMFNEVKQVIFVLSRQIWILAAIYNADVDLYLLLPVF